MKINIVTVIVLGFCLASSCRTRTDSSTVASQDGEEIEAAHAEELEQLGTDLQNILSQYGVAESLSLGGELKENEVVPTVTKLSLNDIEQKVSSLRQHIAFVKSQLENPNSTYHQQLKSKKIQNNPETEKKLIIFSENALSFTDISEKALTKSTAKIPSSLRKTNLMTSRLLTQKFKSNLAKTYKIFVTLDNNFQAAESAIKAKETIEETATKWASDFGEFLQKNMATP